jgi:type I restriction enzyme S subunit
VNPVSDYALPEGWADASLAEICELNPPKPSADFLPPDSEVTFAPMPAVDADAGALTAPEIRHFSKVRNGHPSFRDGDVIMAKITPCMENGKAAVLRGLKNGIGFGSTEFHILRPTDAVLAEYIYYFIRQESFREAAAAEMTGSVGQKRVPASFLEGTEIPIPPLAEQMRIVAKVETLLARVNAARQRLAKAPAILKRFRQSVLAAACSGRLTADWREEQDELEPAELLIDRILKLAGKNQMRNDRNGQGGLEELPKGWAWAPFGDLIQELRNGIGTKPNPDPPGHPILRISAVRPGKVILDDIRFHPDADDLVALYRLRDGDLLFTRYNGSLDLLGVCGMVRGLKNRTLVYPDKLMRVRIGHSNLLPPYVEIFFGSPLARDRIEAKSKSSAGQQGVSGADIKGQPIAVPPLTEQQEIVRRVEALFKLADAIEKRVAAATARGDKLTQAILAKAFRGELVPTEAELARREGRDYEPASALLERIRAERADKPEESKRKPKPQRKRPLEHPQITPITQIKSVRSVKSV